MPIAFHQVRSVFTANAEVSWSIPTDTQPSSAPMSYTPYGIALGTPAGKSCPFTLTGEPCGWYSRPLFAYSPTNSFFLQSRLTTGSPASTNSRASTSM